MRARDTHRALTCLLPDLKARLRVRRRRPALLALAPSMPPDQSPALLDDPDRAIVAWLVRQRLFLINLMQRPRRGQPRRSTPCWPPPARPGLESRALGPVRHPREVVRHRRRRASPSAREGERPCPSRAPSGHRDLGRPRRARAYVLVRPCASSGQARGCSTRALSTETLARRQHGPACARGCRPASVASLLGWQSRATSPALAAATSSPIAVGEPSHGCPRGHGARRHAFVVTSGTRLGEFVPGCARRS